MEGTTSQIRSCINGILQKHQRRAIIHSSARLKEPEKEEIPLIIELDPSSFYRGYAAKDYKYQPTNVRGKEREGIKSNLVDMNNFFAPPMKNRKKSKNRPRRGMRTMLIGPAGSGKSMVLSTFPNEVAEGKIDQMKQEGFMAHCVNCRELDPKVEISVPEFLFKNMLCEEELSKEDKEYAHKRMEAISEKVLLVIDSLDTMRFSLERVKRVIGPYDVATPDVILHNILTGKLFKESFILTSSREDKIKGFKGALRPDKILLLAGLTENSIENIITGYVGKKNKERILNSIRQPPMIEETA